VQLSSKFRGASNAASLGIMVSDVMCGHVVMILDELVLYATLSPEVFAIVWLHARPGVTLLCCTPTYGLYDRASNTSTPSI
jgi:hypothetical protein